MRPVHGFNPPKRWPTREEMRLHAIRAGSALLAPFIPTTLGNPSVHDQGGAGSCFGFAAAQGVHILKQAAGIMDPFPSPVVPYWMARREAVQSDAEVTDSGSDPDSMIKALNSFGVCSLSEAPYNDTTVNLPPGDVALLAAQQVRCKLSPILASGPALWDQIRHAIQIERCPVLIALEVVPAFDNVGADGIVDDPTGPSRGLHAQCLCGFDGVGALDANSWGLGFGRHGCATLTPRFLAGAVVWAGALSLETP